MAADEDKPKQDPEPGEPTGGPDWKRAANDHSAQRDQAREQVEQMQKQLDELKKSTEGLFWCSDILAGNQTEGPVRGLVQLVGSSLIRVESR